MRRFAAALFVVALLFLLPRAAAAHTIGLSHGEYRLDGGDLHAKITLRNEDLANAAPRADVDGDGRLGDVEIEKNTTLLDDVVTKRIRVHAGDTECTRAPSAIHPDGADGVAYELDFACAGRGAVAVDLDFLGAMPSGHRHLASITVKGETRDELVVLADPHLAIGESNGEATHASGFGGLVVDGLFHILTGPDHLAFLIGVLLSFAVLDGKRTSVRGRIGPLAWMLTAFTVGHSAALATATIGGIAPSSRFIEPAVALSVAYIGLENLASFRVQPRALVTLTFGFVHGFAYASGLLPLGIPKERLPFAVVAFNVGVEIGQLLVVAVVLPLLLFGERRPGFSRVRKVIAGSLVLAGLIWFADRVIRGS